MYNRGKNPCTTHGLGAAGDLQARDLHLPGAGATWGPTPLVDGPCGDWTLLQSRGGQLAEKPVPTIEQNQYLI